MELRQYQKDVLNNIVRSHRKGNKRILLQAATGSGKTVMAVAFIEYYLKQGKKVMFLAHRRELIHQAAETLKAFGIDYGIIMASETKEKNAFADVQVVSVDTLRARAINKKKIDLPGADLMIIDEAHRSMSNTYKKIIELYPDSLVLGLTATPVRSDGTGLGLIYEDMVKAPDIKELIASGSLCEAIYYSPTVPDLTGIKMTAGDYNKKSLAALMETSKNLVADILQTWFSLANGKQTLLFATSVKHSQSLMESFVDKGVTAAHIDGSTELEERQRILEAFSRKEITIICNCMVLTEGFDAPSAEVCILARPTKSKGLYIQMIGRVLRPYKDKANAIIIDHSGAVYLHGFIDEDHDWKLTYGKEQEATSGEAKPQEEKVIICEGCFRSYSGSNICPQCGKIHNPKSRYVETIEGKLGLVNKKTRQLDEMVTYDPNYKRNFYAELLGYAHIKHYAANWARWKYKSKFNEWPVYGEVTPIRPSKEISNFITHLHIKERYKNKKAG